MIWFNFSQGLCGNNLDSGLTIYYAQNISNINNPISICSCRSCKNCKIDGQGLQIHTYYVKLDNITPKNTKWSTTTTDYEVYYDAMNIIRTDFYKSFYHTIDTIYHKDNIFKDFKNIIFKNIQKINIREIIQKVIAHITKTYTFNHSPIEIKSTKHFPLQITSNIRNKLIKWIDNTL